MFFIFFFQAEDGIRDKLVTGVQTCALPICSRRHVVVPRQPAAVADGELHAVRAPLAQLPPDDSGAAVGAPYSSALESNRTENYLGDLVLRSEERRVGKECRCGWSAQQERKK